MASSKDDEKPREESDDAARRERDDGRSGVRQTVEVAARVYFDFCKKAARTINRLKSSD